MVIFVFIKTLSWETTDSLFIFQLPDHPDERMLLIAELNKSGKIQTSAYDQYLQACEREKQALLEGDFAIHKI